MELRTSHGDKVGVLVQKFPAGETLVRILEPIRKHVANLMGKPHELVRVI